MTKKDTNRKDFAGVIFDLDGTLLDSLGGIALSMNRVLEKLGLASIPVDSYKHIVGDGLEEMVRRVLRLYRKKFPDPAEDEIASLVSAYRREYDILWRANSRPYPGIPELLRQLSKLKIRKAVLSNKSHPYTELMVREIFRDCEFDVIKGALPGIPLKPDPASAMAVAAETGIATAAFVFLGDTAVDMKTACAAGMYPVGALWGFRDEAELTEAGARMLIAHPLDLLTLLFHL